MTHTYLESNDIEPYFSIILPIYNVEKYLKQCVESIQRQNFENIEIILVDDGSPDSCPKICDTLASKDARIRVIHKENGGLSDARNAGAAIARGEYIIFVDSDDFWQGANGLQAIYDEIMRSEEQADIVRFATSDYYEATGMISVTSGCFNQVFLRSANIVDAVTSLVDTGLFPGAAWCLAVRRGLLTDNDIMFIKGFIPEDTDWIFNVFCHAKKCLAVNEMLYVYRKGGSDAITGQNSEMIVQNMLTTVETWEERLNTEFPALKAPLMKRLSYVYCTALVKSGGLTKAAYASICDSIKKNSHLLKTEGVTDKRVRLSRALYSLVGDRTAGIILRKMLNYKRKSLQIKSQVEICEL